MTGEFLIPYLFIFFGVIMIVLSFPSIRGRTVERLKHAGWITKNQLKKKDQEIIYGAGPNLSLAVTGVLFIVFGIILIA